LAKAVLVIAGGISPLKGQLAKSFSSFGSSRRVSKSPLAAMMKLAE